MIMRTMTRTRTMRTEPIVVVPDDDSARARIGKALSDLSDVARSASFKTGSSTGQRVSLTARHHGSEHQVVIRSGDVGAPSDGIGMNIIHRIDRQRSATIADLSVAADTTGRLRSRRTMHDHRPRIEAWSALFRSGLDRAGGIPPIAMAALDFCEAHVAASMETTGCSEPKTVHLRLGAGDMPLLVRIAGIETHIDLRFVIDDHPVMSRTLQAILTAKMPQGWSFLSPNRGDVVIAPLHVGHRIVRRAGTIEALRILGSPEHRDLPRSFD